MFIDFWIQVDSFVGKSALVHVKNLNQTSKFFFQMNLYESIWKINRIELNSESNNL